MIYLRGGLSDLVALGAKKCSYVTVYLYTYIYVNTCRKVYLEKLIVPHAVNKLPKFYGTGRFITVFTRARHWTLP